MSTKLCNSHPSCPVLQRRLYFHAEWEGWHWWKVCRKTWNPKQRKYGLARVVIDLELESKILDLWFLLIWDHSLVSETKGEVYTNTYPHLSPLYIWGGGMGSSQDVQPPLKHKRRKAKRGYFSETAGTISLNLSNSINTGIGVLSHVIITNI